MYFFLYIFKKSTANLCEYTQKWYCKDCFSKEKSIIPARVLNFFDFSLYGVSNEGLKIIQELRSKPIIKIPYNNENIRKNENFYETLVYFVLIKNLLFF